MAGVAVALSGGDVDLVSGLCDKHPCLYLQDEMVSQHHAAGKILFFDWMAFGIAVHSAFVPPVDQDLTGIFRCH